MVQNKDRKIKNLKISSVTPILSHGANKKEPEIRIPEFKSAMRFWWRALNWFNINNIDTRLKEELKKKEYSCDYLGYMKFIEGKIFGDSKNNASPISIKLKSFNNPQSNPYVYGITGFENVRLELTLIEKYPSILNQLPNWRLENYYELLEITSIIGAIGQRSRRGYGVFKIDNSNIYSNINNEFLRNKLNKLFGDIYKIGSSEYNEDDDIEIIKRNKKCRPPRRFPFVEEIFIGKEISFDTYKKSIKTAIWKNFDEKNEYKNTKRYACPVYISGCYGGTNKIIPIITVLYNTQIVKSNGKNDEKYDKYKKYVSNFVRECIK